jgi:hypothetical protein
MIYEVIYPGDITRGTLVYKFSTWDGIVTDATTGLGKILFREYVRAANIIVKGGGVINPVINTEGIGSLKKQPAKTIVGWKGENEVQS